MEKQSKFPHPSCQSFPCQTRECCSSGHKFIWPELLRKGAEEAKAIIVKDNPLVTVVPVRKGSPVTDDFRCNRVWLRVDENDEVMSVPWLDRKAHQQSSTHQNKSICE